MKTPFKLKKGYTLVEILVVVAIIASLAGVSYPIVTRQIVEGKRADARSMMKTLDQGLTQYLDDNHNLYPVNENWTADWNTNDFMYIHQPDRGGGFVVRALIGKPSDTEVMNNYRAKSYFDAPDYAPGKSGICYDEDYEISGLLDPWGSGFRTYCDRDFDGVVDVSTMSLMTHNPMRGTDAEYPGKVFSGCLGETKDWRRGFFSQQIVKEPSAP